MRFIVQLELERTTFRTNGEANMPRASESFYFFRVHSARLLCTGTPRARDTTAFFAVEHSGASLVRSVLVAHFRRHWINVRVRKQLARCTFIVAGIVATSVKQFNLVFQKITAMLLANAKHFKEIMR